MTNPSISPCPKCRNMPELINGAFGTCFGCKKCDIAAPRRDRWELLVRDVLGHACRELGIETVEQLKAKVHPDPWVGINWITANIAPVERVISRGVYESILLHITPKRGEPYVSIGRFIDGEFIPDGHSGDWHKYVTHWASINTIAAQRGEGV